LQNVFCSVFELPSLRNTRKRDKTKKVEEKLSSKLFVEILGKVFDMDFLQKCFYGVFELPLPRNAQKRTKKKVKKKKSRMVGGWVGDSVNVRGGPSIFFLAAPRYWPMCFSHAGISSAPLSPLPAVLWSSIAFRSGPNPSDCFYKYAVRDHTDWQRRIHLRIYIYKEGPTASDQVQAGSAPELSEFFASWRSKGQSFPLAQPT
jgi:hypothetical protein